MPLLLNNRAASPSNRSEVDSYIAPVTIPLTYEISASVPKDRPKAVFTVI
jgi:hypothetical protein